MGRTAGAARSRTPTTAASHTYEPEGAERVIRGSVALDHGAHWHATLEVPLHGDQSALLTIARDAAGQPLEPREAVLVIPPTEAQAVIKLLSGIIRQARSERIIP